VGDEVLEGGVDGGALGADQLGEEALGEAQGEDHGSAFSSPPAVGQVPEQEVESLFEVWDLDDGQA
jgi:hypothetical protein